MTQVVYFAEKDGRIKIGCSGSLKSRLGHLGASLIGAMPGDFKDERAMHARFAEYRQEGEWFDDAPELRAFAAALPPVPDTSPMTTAAVASLLRVSEATVRSWATKGLIGYFRTPGGRRRFPYEAVQKLMRDQDSAA